MSGLAGKPRYDWFREECLARLCSIQRTEFAKLGRAGGGSKQSCVLSGSAKKALFGLAFFGEKLKAFEERYNSAMSPAIIKRVSIQAFVQVELLWRLQEIRSVVFFVK